MTDQRCLTKAIMDLHVAIGLRAIQAKPHKRPQTPPVVAAPLAPDLQMPRIQDANVAALYAKFGKMYIDKLVHWLSGILREGQQASAPVQWVSFLQLFLIFLIHNSFVPPVYVKSSKIWMRSPHVQAPLPHRVRWFSDHIKAVVKASAGVVHTACLRPASAALVCRLLSVPIAVCPARLDEVDRYLAAHAQAVVGAPKARWQQIALPEAALR
eukprot:s58_g2.t1